MAQIGKQWQQISAAPLRPTRGSQPGNQAGRHALEARGSVHGGPGRRIDAATLPVESNDSPREEGLRAQLSITPRAAWRSVKKPG